MIFRSLRCDGSINFSSHPASCLPTIFHSHSIPLNWFNVFATFINFHSLIYFSYSNPTLIAILKSFRFRFDFATNNNTNNNGGCKIEREKSDDGSLGKQEWMRWLYCKISDIKLQKQECRRAEEIFLFKTIILHSDDVRKSLEIHAFPAVCFVLYLIKEWNFQSDARNVLCNWFFFWRQS